MFGLTFLKLENYNCSGHRPNLLFFKINFVLNWELYYYLVRGGYLGRIKKEHMFVPGSDSLSFI